MNKLNQLLEDNVINCKIYLIFKKWESINHLD